MKSIIHALTIISVTTLALPMTANATSENKTQLSIRQNNADGKGVEPSATSRMSIGSEPPAAVNKPGRAKVSKANTYSYRYKTISGGVVSDWTDWIYANGENCMENILTPERLTNGEIYAVGIDDRFGDDYHYFISTVQYYIKEFDLSQWKPATVGENGYYQAWANIDPDNGKLPSIETLILPDKEFEIGGSKGTGAFQFWIKLKNVQFGPNSKITRLAPSAFQECHKLSLASCQAILDHLADGTDIGEQAFDRCDEDLVGSVGLTIPSTVRSIGNYAFSLCKLLEGVNISEGVTVIGDHAFNECYNIKSASIPSTVTEIKNYAFVSCNKLQDMTVADGVRFTIGEGAFTYCYDMLFDENFLVDHLSLDQTVIYPKTFRCCSSMKSIVIPARITAIQNDASNTDGNGAFQYTLSLEKVTFEDRTGTLALGNFVFKQQEKIGNNDHKSGETKLKEIHFGSGTYAIGSRCFENAEHLKDITLEEGTAIRSLGKACFAECHPLTSASINALLAHLQSTEVPMWAFWNCNGSNSTYNTGNTANFTELVLPASIATLRTGAFGSSTTSAISKITVSRSEAPRCLNYSEGGFNSGLLASVFQGVEPNHVTVAFDGEADAWAADNLTGYKSYMFDKYDSSSPSFAGQDGEWHRLLTKTLSEQATSYDLVPQQHAIVKLTRHLVKGWNTLCLPFGATNRNEDYYNGYADAANARLFVNALRAESSTDAAEGDFMIAVYRGWNKEANLFRFLRYTNYDSNPLYPYEAIKVRMGADDLRSDDIYTFTDVDVNYKWTDATTPVVSQPEDMTAEKFNGDRDIAAQPPFNDGKTNTTDYVFRGTFHRMQGIVGKEYNGYTIPLTAGKDYYYQTNSEGKTCFYTYKADDKVIIRGFSGWLSYVGSNLAAPLALPLMMQVYDEANSILTEVMPLSDAVDTTAGEQPFDVYSLGGQLLLSKATSLSGLPRGIYVVSGRKVMVR